MPADGAGGVEFNRAWHNKCNHRLAMKKINEAEVPGETRQSPKGRFGITRKHMSLALGGKPDTGIWDGGHPFDVELSSIEPGQSNYPFHSHAAQWEYYIIISGEGRFLDNEKNWHDLAAGDHLTCPPEEAHLIENNGSEPLVYYVIADHHIADITSYPSTGKKFLKPDGGVVTIESADYYEGEE